uniref:WD repeat-containing protein 74 n=1 Tax=Panagrolaimus sp. JU765 TaxID=591449 RepID=A0AC34RMJ8_9BILA
MIDCYIGAATGAFKAVNFKEAKVTNLNRISGLVPKNDEIVAICWGDEEQTEVVSVQADRKIKITNVNRISGLVPKNDEIVAMCWGDEEQTEVVSVQADRKIKVYNELTELYSDLFDAECVEGEGPIKAIRWIKENGNIVTAAGSGHLAVWNNQGKRLSPDNWTAGADLLAMDRNPELLQIATGGKANLLKTWDLERHENVWSAKNVPVDWLYVPVPIWDTNVKYLNQHEMVTTTGKGQIRVYDPRKDQRPVQDFVYMDCPITALSLCYKERFIVVGNTTGNVSVYDLRNTKNQIVKLRSFAGSVRSIDAHPKTPFMVSVGLDRHIRLHHIGKKKLIKKIYAKVHLNSVLFKKINSCEKVKPDDMRWEKEEDWKD